MSTLGEDERLAVPPVGTAAALPDVVVGLIAAPGPAAELAARCG